MLLAESVEVGLYSTSNGYVYCEISEMDLVAVDLFDINTQEH
jgi:hypothetical protein